MKKTVSIVNGIVRVNGMARGRIEKSQINAGWYLGPTLRNYFRELDGSLSQRTLYQHWPTHKAAAEWVKEQLT